MAEHPYGIALFPQHAELLAASAIAPEVARARNYQSVDTKTRLASIDIPVAHRLVPGLLFPTYGPDAKPGEASTWQYRPDHPRVDAKGRPVKYVTAQRGMTVDVPSAVRPHIGDPDRPLWITEGIRKVDSAVSHGIDCLGVLGVWNWRGTNASGGTTALAAWEYIALNDREVYLCFDSDVMVKPEVRKALMRFAGFLKYRKAEVRLVILPDVETGKTGLDDYLAAGGTIDALHDDGRIIWPIELARFSPPGNTATPQHRWSGDVPTIAVLRDILTEVGAEARKRGLVGEERLAQILFLVLTSRLLDQQVSAGVKGHSASGKSYTVETVTRLFPPESYLTFTAFSERSLVYSPEQYAHRTIVIYELTALREGVEDDMTSYFIRTLLSEGRIDYEVTVRDAEGGFTTKKIVKEGPTNLIFTTTKTKVHAENETRIISLATNDSSEQTARVLMALADEDLGSDDLQRWHDLQRWLAAQDNRVTIPFGPQLATSIPPVAVRLRRDFGALLAMIRAHAVLHQASRKRDGSGRIIATLEDYEVVRGLVVDVMSEGVGTTVSPTVREVVGAIAALATPEGVGLREVAQKLRLDKSNVSRRLTRAADGGYVRNLEDKRGRPARWIVGEPLPDEVVLLPDVAQLRNGAQRPDLDRCGVAATPGGESETSAEPASATGRWLIGGGT